MKIDLSQFRQTFLQESADHIETMESRLLDLRTSPADAEVLNAIFRSAHSIKGGAGSFGFEHLAHFTHVLENLLERLRSLELPLTDEILNALLESVDVLRALLEAGSEGEPPAGIEALQARLSALAGAATAEAEHAPASDPASGPAAAAAGPPEAGAAAPLHTFRIDFRPDREMLASGSNPLLLLRNLRDLGSVTVTHLNTDELPSLAQLDPAKSYLAWTIEIATSEEESALREVFEFVEHLAEIAIRRVEPVSPAAVPAAAAPAAAEKPAAKAPAKKSAATKRAAGGESSSIRVSTEKVDRLIDLVGELVIAHVMTAQMVDNFSPQSLPKLRESVAAMERNTRELHESVMAIRMLPVGTIFQRYVRTVHDIAQATGKQIRLVFSGEETEMDKSMLELLSDPLTHLIRNSADHGIETPEVRVAAGKPAEGTIHLRAFHRSGRVVIEISDDGAGINLERVRGKAVERGLIAADAELSDEQIRLLIFQPGFSTRDQISDLSGRGVGMDVVKQNVELLNGSIRVASEFGRGSTMSIELPLTLAILEGLVIRVQDRTMVLPLLAVVETVSPRPGQLERIAEMGEVIVIRKESIPLLNLRRFLGLGDASPGASDNPGHASERWLVVVVEAGRRKIGLIVDELLGQQQVVVKSLERHLRKVDGLMGATILGDGCVAPILDVTALANMNLYTLPVPPALPAPAVPAAHGSL